MSGYDPSVTKEAVNDPGILMSLIGMSLPNVTRGDPNQGGYVLRPGKVLQNLGETYSMIKNRQESLGAAQDYAQQASRGTQFAPFGGEDPEAVAWEGRGSPIEQAQNLASFHPQTFGSFLSGASPDRLRGIFAGSRGGTQLEQALGLPSGQTPFERVFQTIQTGEETALKRKREQARVGLAQQLAREPFNPELRQAMMSLSPPEEVTRLSQELEEQQGQVRYFMNKDLHGGRAVSQQEAEGIVAARLGPQHALELQRLQSAKQAADLQIKVLEQSQIGAALKQDLIRYLRISGMPIPDLERKLTDGRTAQLLSDIQAKSPHVRTLLSQLAPLDEKQMAQVLAIPEVQADPEIAKMLTDINRTKYAAWEQHQDRLVKINELTQNRELALQHRAGVDYTTSQSRFNDDAKKAQDSMLRFRESTQGLKQATETPQQYFDRLNKDPLYQGYQKNLLDAEKGKRQSEIEYSLATDPERLINYDRYDMPQQLRSIAGDTHIPPEVRAKQIEAKLKQLPRLQAEYGNRVDALIKKRTKDPQAPGWSDQVIPEVQNVGKEMLDALKAEQARALPAQPTLTPPATAESTGRSVGEAVRGAATAPVRAGIKAGEAIKQVPPAIKGFGRGFYQGLTPPEPAPTP